VIPTWPSPWFNKTSPTAQFSHKTQELTCGRLCAGRFNICAALGFGHRLPNTRRD
jgi:hypothetical protein